MGNLKRLKTQADRQAVGTVALSAAGLAIATDITQVQNANAVVHMIDGEFMADLAATDGNGALDALDSGAAETLNPDGDTPAKCLFLFSVDKAGAVHINQSEIVNPEGAPGYAQLDGKVSWPDLPDGECAFGGVEVEVDSATSFVPGTTALNAAGVTTTYVDMAHIPAGRR